MSSISSNYSEAAELSRPPTTDNNIHRQSANGSSKGNQPRNGSSLASFYTAERKATQPRLIKSSAHSEPKTSLITSEIQEDQHPAPFCSQNKYPEESSAAAKERVPAQHNGGIKARITRNSTVSVTTIPFKVQI